MFRPLSVNIGMRYAGSSHGHLSLVTFVALTGLTLSVSVLLFVQGVVAGFERELTNRILRVIPHVSVRARESIATSPELLQLIGGIPHVEGSAAVIQGQALLSLGQKVRGITITGIEPDQYRRVSRINQYVRGGDLIALNPGQYGIIVGDNLAKDLGLKIGSSATVVVPDVTVTPLGAFPRQKSFRVQGILDTGSQLDQRYVFLHRLDAAKLYRLGRGVHSIEVWLDDPLRAREVGLEILATLSDEFVVSTWFQTYGPLYSAIRAQKGMMLLLLSLLVAVASINLVSTLVMIVSERRGDIAILRTMGSNRSLIIATFVILGLAISAVGVAAGIGLGYFLGVLAEAGFPTLESFLGVKLMGEYVVDTLPFALASTDVWHVAGIAGLLTLLATLYPAWRASSSSPAEALQYE
ncbi:MAG: FtsX-like permease family protein [Pseudomonadales bacterium]|jgi:lipoprotein-releasing system permease protein